MHFGHIEVTAEMVEDWCDLGADELAEAASSPCATLQPTACLLVFQQESGYCFPYCDVIQVYDYFIEKKQSEPNHPLTGRRISCCVHLDR